MGRGEVLQRLGFLSLKGRDRFEGTLVDWKIILKYISEQ
jgi:hypothetical protein